MDDKELVAIGMEAIGRILHDVHAQALATADMRYLAHAVVNGVAFREMMTREPEREIWSLTRGQLEAICRDLIAATKRDEEAAQWAEQATKNAADIHRLTARIAELEGKVA